MATLQIIDLVLTLPPDVSVATEQEEDCRIFLTLGGPRVTMLRQWLEEEATRRGYGLRRTNDASYLDKGEGHIAVHLLGPSRLGIRVDDAESLPHAKTWKSGIGIADLLIPIPGEITAGRECIGKAEGTVSSVGHWYVVGAPPEAVASTIHDYLLSQGLRLVGAWKPPKDGVPRWRIDASSTSRLVQAKILENENRLDIEVRVIDSVN